MLQLFSPFPIPSSLRCFLSSRTSEQGEQHASAAGGGCAWRLAGRRVARAPHERGGRLVRARQPDARVAAGDAGKRGGWRMDARGLMAGATARKRAERRCGALVATAGQHACRLLNYSVISNNVSGTWRTSCTCSPGCAMAAGCISDSSFVRMRAR